MNLSEKIELLIKRKQLSASQFADKLGIPRSSISHILSGRNKPSLDVVQKILRVFPEISAEDLLFEDRSLGASLVSTASKESPIVPASPSLFDAVLPSPSESPIINSPEQTIVQSNLRRPKETAVPSRVEEPIVPVSPQRLEKSIERVLIFYTDGTFSESRPI